MYIQKLKDFNRISFENLIRLFTVRNNMESECNRMINQYRKNVNEVLAVLHHDGASVTDESTFWDFCPISLTRRGKKQWIEHVEKTLEVPATLDEYIWQVACKLYEKDDKSGGEKTH